MCQWGSPGDLSRSRGGTSPRQSAGRGIAAAALLPAHPQHTTLGQVSNQERAGFRACNLPPAPIDLVCGSGAVWLVPPVSPHPHIRVCCGQSPSLAAVGSCWVRVGVGLQSIFTSGSCQLLADSLQRTSAWPRTLRYIYFLSSPAPITDGPGRGQHPGSRVGPLVTATQVDVTDASLMAVIAPSYFTRLLPQHKSLGNGFLIGSQ